MNYDRLRQLNNEIFDETKQNSKNMQNACASIHNTREICQNSEFVLTQLDEEFLKRVKLTKKDLPFLFFAIALQTLRWILLPSLNLDFQQISNNDRLDANEIKKAGILKGERSGQRYEKPKINEIKARNPLKYQDESTKYREKLRGNSQHEYLSWLEILFHAVPYDAMEGSENILIRSKNILNKVTFESPLGKQLYGKNHHVATLGHDPVLGWFFGTLNIMSGMITFCDLQTYPVISDVQLDKWNQHIDYLHPSSIPQMIQYCIGSFMEDPKRLPAAVARQAIHMKSDALTKDGLPIPLLSPDKAQKLIDKGWNSNEAKRLIEQSMQNIAVIGAQFLVAELINTVIRSVYLMINHTDDEIQYSAVKVEKILKISSLIAEASNVAVVVATQNLSLMDIGGYISLVHQIFLDNKTRHEIEDEFIKNNFEKIILEA